MSSPFIDASPADFYELPPLSTEYLHILYSAAVPIVVVDLLKLSFQELKQIIPPSPHAILVVNAAVGPNMTREFERALINYLKNDELNVLFVDIEGGLRATNAFSENPTALDAIQRFQNGLLASNVSQLRKTLQNLLSTNPEEFEVRSKAAATQAALASLRGMLRQAYEQLESAEVLANEMLASAADQKEELAKFTSRESIMVALRRSEEDLKKTLKDLSFWRLFLLLDDIEYFMSKTLYQSHLQDLRSEVRILSTQECQASSV